ncbi:MAG: DNA polymerase III subunit delta [Duodenibacillus sp.]
MQFDQLARAMEAGIAQRPPLWLITGEETLSMLEAADMLRAQARSEGYSEREVLHASAHWDWSQIFDSCQAMSLFGDLKLVELRLASAKPGPSGSKALETLSQMPLDGVIVLVTIPYDYSLAKAKWFAALQQAAGANVVQCPCVRAQELPAWFNARFARNGQTAEPEAVRLLCERCEGNLLAANQEVLKLAYRHPCGAVISAQDINDSVSDVSRFDIDNLLDAVCMGDAPKAVRVVHNLRAKDEAIPSFLWALTEEIRMAAHTRNLLDGGMPREAAVKAAGAGWANHKERVTRAVSRMSARKLESALILAGDIDRISKGLIVADRDSDAWLELESLVGFLAR